MKKFLENFWYYHKFKLLVALMVVMVLVNTISAFTSAEALDYTISMVTVKQIPDSLRQAVSEAFSARLPDTNGDGQVLVQVQVYNYSPNQEILPNNWTEDDAVHLAADIQTGESCLFLADEPDVFQEIGLGSGGDCQASPLLADVAGQLEGFVFFFPQTVDPAVAEVLG